MIYPGYILARLSRWAKEHRERTQGADGANELIIDDHQCNGMHCVHQASVRLQNDPTTYRMIIAPANAPLELYGRPIDEAFGKPLTDWPPEPDTEKGGE